MQEHTLAAAKYNAANEGRRRLATSATSASTSAGTRVEPTQHPIEDALGFIGDRLDRLEHLIDSLNGTVMRAGTVLEDVFTGGAYIEPVLNEESMGNTPEDRRSTLARRITGNAVRIDRLGDGVSLIERRIEAILDAVEL